MAHTFKVGDTVRVTDSGAPSANNGDKGIIIEIDDDPMWPFEVQFDGTTGTVPFAARELTLVLSAASAA